MNILFSDKSSFVQAVFLGLSFAGAMYTHYFAFMFIGWMGVSGLLYLNKNNILKVFTAGSLGMLLFIPHLGITQYHLDVGGLQWLGGPSNSWLLEFLFHAFNESLLLIVGIVSILILSFVFRNKIKLNDKRQFLICFLWFFGIYTVGHLYSIIETPVLKFPVMLFAFPFFLLIIAHLLAQFMFQRVLFALLIVMISLSTIFEKDLFGHMHYELFEEISDEILAWEDELGKENIYTVYNLNNPNYMNFYANQKGRAIDFDWDVIEFGEAKQIREELKNREEDYCIVGFSARLTLVQVFESCKEFYPNIIDGHKYNNSSVYLLGKKGSSKINQEEYVLADFQDLNDSSWVLGQQKSNDKTRNGQGALRSYVLSGQDVYGPEYHFKLTDIPTWESSYIKVGVTADVQSSAQLTASFFAKRDGENLMYRDEFFWEGRDLEEMIKDKGNGYFVFKIPSFIKEDDDLIVSFWNRNSNSPVTINDVKIVVLDNIWN